MARTAVSKRIGDTTYHVIPLTTSEALAAAVRVANTLGPMVAKWDVGSAAAIGQLLTDVKQDDIEYFTDLFRPLTTFDAKGAKARQALGADAVYEDHFAANLGALVDWLTFCIQVNFSSFFPKIGAFVKNDASKSAPAESPATEGTEPSP